MVLESLFSNGYKEPSSIRFPQGQQFNALQNGKIMENKDRADRLLDPNGFSTADTILGQRALGGATINMEMNQSIIEGFDTNIQKSHIAQQNQSDKATRLSLSNEATEQTSQYENAIGSLINASKAFAEAPPDKHPPTNSYIAQSVPNPTAANGSTAVGKDYVPVSKSGLGNAAPASGDVTCAGSDVNGCATMCQARTFDEGGIGFVIRQDTHGNTCTPIIQQTEFDNLREYMSKNSQKLSIPGGSWLESIVPGSQPQMKGNILVAQLRDANGQGKTARVRVTDPNAIYSNINGAFRQDLNGDAGFGAINITNDPPGLKSKMIEGNTLIMTTNDGVTYSAEVESGDIVTFQPAASKVACSYDTQCKAAGLPTWVDGVPRPNAFHCPGINDHCFDPSTGKYAEVGQLVVKKSTSPSIDPMSERHLYSVNYSVGGNGVSGASSHIDTNSLGGIYYIDADGQSPYTGNVNWNTASYASVGNFRTDGGMSNNQAATSSACESACNSSESCKGYTFTNAGVDPTTGQGTPASCYIMGENDWPKNPRTYDVNSEMMMRLPEINNTGPGCPKNVLVDAASTLNGKRRIQAPKGCGIAGVIGQYEDKIKGKNQQLMKTQGVMLDTMYGLLNNDAVLQNKLASSLDQMKDDIYEYENVNKDAQSAAQGLTQATARSEDTKVQLMSDNYHYLLWSILAIALVLGGIKASRN